MRKALKSFQKIDLTSEILFNGLSLLYCYFEIVKKCTSNIFVFIQNNQQQNLLYSAQKYISNRYLNRLPLQIFANYLSQTFFKSHSLKIPFCEL